MTRLFLNLSLVTDHWSLLEWLDRLWRRDFVAALFASASRVIRPKIFHCLAEMFDNVGTVEIDILDQRAAVVTVKNHMLVFARWSASFHNHTDCVRRTNRRVRLRDEQMGDPVVRGGRQGRPRAKLTRAPCTK